MLAQSPASFALATLRYAPSDPCRWTHCWRRLSWGQARAAPMFDRKLIT